jgi:hypothetical protein
MTGNEHTGKVKNEWWSESKLENGDPMEFEDKWGKENSANYSIKIPGI